MPSSDIEKRREQSREYRRKLGEIYRAKHRQLYNTSKKRSNTAWISNPNHIFRCGRWGRNDGFYIQ